MKERLTNFWRAAFAVDLRSLGIFRIGLALVLLCDLFQDFLDAPALFTRDGVLPRTLWATMYEFTGLWSFHLYNDSIFGARLVLTVQIAFAVMLLMGYRTRLATAVSWVLFVSLINRNIIASDGGDQIASYLMFCGIFLPLGARYSLDSRREKITGNEFFGLGSSLILSQMIVMYLFAGLAKMTTVSWGNGEALDITLRWTEYTKPFAEVVRGQAWLTRLMTGATPWLEVVGPWFFLCFGRARHLRIAAVLAFALLHVSIEATLRLGFFSAYSMVGLIALLPAAGWEFIERKSAWFARASAAQVTGTSPAPLARIGKIAGLGLALCSVYSTVPALIGEERAPYPIWLARVNDITFGWQNWNLFREPLPTSGWYRAKALLGNGKTVDLFQNGVDYLEDKPRVPSDAFPSRRWLSFIMHAHMQWDTPELRENIARVVAKQWNETHSEEETIWSLNILYYGEAHPPFAPSVPVDSYEFARYALDPTPTE